MSESIEIYNSVKNDNYIQFKNLFNKLIVTDDDIFNINYQSEVSEVIYIIYIQLYTCKHSRIIICLLFLILGWYNNFKNCFRERK